MQEPLKRGLGGCGLLIIEVIPAIPAGEQPGPALPEYENRTPPSHGSQGSFLAPTEAVDARIARGHVGVVGEIHTTKIRLPEPLSSYTLRLLFAGNSLISTHG